MFRQMAAALLVLAAHVSIHAPAAGQAAEAQAAPAFTQRAEDLVAFFRGEADPEALFSADFLAQVPVEQLNAVTEQLRAQHGEAVRIAGIQPRSAHAGTVLLETERAVLRMNMTVDPEQPHRIVGLLVTGAEARNDDLASIAAELAQLPGQTSFAAARLGSGQPEIIAAHAAGQALAIGSAFKLFILAELSRQVQADQHAWEDVVRIDRRSLPSGILQDWPEGSPVTIHTLAGLMISRSDNTATDMLLHLVGRENVERMMATLGVSAAARNRPFLTTLELFALKSAPEEVLETWWTGDEAARRRLLAERISAIRPDQVDLTRLTSAPNNIDLLEWFASAEDLVRVMDWLRTRGDETSRGILAINSGLGETDPGGPAYVGYKGGSEPGVMNMTYLVRSPSGAWHAVAGTWNNPEAAVDQARFAALMRRAVLLLP